MAMVKDPVCGMEIDSETAAGSSEYEGSTYYFCSEQCKKDFDAAPWKFMSSAAGLKESMEEPAGMPMGGKEQAAPKVKKWWEFWK
jgi:YHS domain-containing protein